MLVAGVMSLKNSPCALPTFSQSSIFTTYCGDGGRKLFTCGLHDFLSSWARKITSRRNTMSDVPDKSTFASLYSGQAPWDIGKPQKSFVDVADRIIGSILDAGCG